MDNNDTIRSINREEDMRSRLDVMRREYELLRKASANKTAIIRDLELEVKKLREMLREHLPPDDRYTL